MAATVQVSHYTSTGPTVTNVESSGVKFNLSDDNASTSPIAIPTSTGTNYSFYKALGLNVTATAATTISNRKISLASAPATGMALFAKDGTASYVQATSGNKPTDSGSNGATPATYTALSNFTAGGLATLTWDSAGVSAGATGTNGHYVLIALGVDSTYSAGGNSAAAVPTIQVQYDEA